MIILIHWLSFYIIIWSWTILKMKATRTNMKSHEMLRMWIDNCWNYMKQFFFYLMKLSMLLLSCFSHVRFCAAPQNGNLPGSPVPGILQVRILEWVAISFSNAWKWKVKVKSLSHVRVLKIPWTEAHQAPPSMGFSRQEYWSGVPLPSLKVSIVKIKRFWLCFQVFGWSDIAQKYPFKY